MAISNSAGIYLLLLLKMSGTTEKIGLVKIIIQMTTTHWKPAVCQHFINRALKYNSSAVKKLFYRQRNGGLENLSLFFFFTIT